MSDMPAVFKTFLTQLEEEEVEEILEWIDRNENCLWEIAKELMNSHPGLN